MEVCSMYQVKNIEVPVGLHTNVSTHNALVTQHGVIDLSALAHLMAWRNQNITWTSADLSVRFCGIHLWAISQLVHKK